MENCNFAFRTEEPIESRFRGKTIHVILLRRKKIPFTGELI